VPDAVKELKAIALKYWKPEPGKEYKLRFLPPQPITFLDYTGSLLPKRDCFLCDSEEERKYNQFRDTMMVEAGTEL
jgi:hypothetical protein